MDNISSSAADASQSRPHHHSPWLHNTLAEVDAKFNTILNLVEDDDGETFAKRAEMYYHNKPQLIHLVQDLHKSYRALAGNHDHLKFDSTRAHNSFRITPDLPTPAAETPDIEPDTSDQIAHDLYNFKITSESLTEDNDFKTVSLSPPQDSDSKTPTEDSSSEAADCGSSMSPDDGVARVDEVSDLEGGGGAEAVWDSMKSSVALLRDNESVLLSFLRKYEEQRAEIKTLKNEVRFVRRLLDVERLDKKEKRTAAAAGIPKLKRALGRLLSVRKN